MHNSCKIENVGIALQRRTTRDIVFYHRCNKSLNFMEIYRGYGMMHLITFFTTQWNGTDIYLFFKIG
eukprot:Gb_16267 [translate_table: standard]